eukprot:gnl/TRDRNA2_/TRDRNA2_176708_c0_seq1.p1 gnl/TRDRNA2_/TRDRNA2_176708_c0~~gnl/TRDRNA2_/TRDRNA2_176708_c0_seq1.p1  ORF type:complete len:431 (+),score=76.83 gnl/TRDRNA2_/TRDRNA2_176708_c0_seq1:78-1370(+)
MLSPVGRVRRISRHLLPSSSAALPSSPDPDGLLEYSVVYTDRSLNHMSKKFQHIMRELLSVLKRAYNAQSVALVPGSGTSAMESVARHFGSGSRCLVIRNGYFSFRWTQILEAGGFASEAVVLKARAVEGDACPMYAPPPVSEVVAAIWRFKPQVVFAPHVETSSGMILPNSYIQAVAAAVHEVGGHFVLDCVASGCLWVDMKAMCVDVLISAPQKSWGGSPSVGLVMLSQRAREAVMAKGSTVFAVDLKKWLTVAETYEQGGHMYHATMPTDSIARFRDAAVEIASIGFNNLKARQLQLGAAVRELLASRGIKSIAAGEFAAPSVVVSYTDDLAVKSGASFAAEGMQIAAGVPLMLDDYTESTGFKTFRLGLFGVDKLQNIPRTVELLAKCIDKILKVSYLDKAHKPTNKLPSDDMVAVNASAASASRY